MSHTAVFSFVRMNPPTVGHQLVVDRLNEVARVMDADPLLYLSHSNDSVKNPLPYLSKLFLATTAFGSCVQACEARTIIDVMKDIEQHYDSVIMVVGSDRVDAFEELLHSYNGMEYKFKSIMVVSAGERDADSDDVDGMSATKMRQAAKDGAIETFTSGLPDALKPMSKIIMNEVRTGLNV